MLLASAFSPVYPCHVPQQVMRTKPVGTGPFKFVEFKRGDSIRLMRNPDYFKKDRPYLDEITVRTIDSRATRMLAFTTGDFDITFPSDITAADGQRQEPGTGGDLRDATTNTQISLLINRDTPPFDNPAIRKAVSLALDRKPINTILLEAQAARRRDAVEAGGRVGHAGRGGGLAARLWPGPYQESRCAGDRAEARLQRNESAPVKVQTRNLPTYRDPAVIITDQFKKVYIKGELDILDTPQW